MMRRFTNLILSIALIASMSSVYALSNFDRWYQVELIVFSHITSQGLNSEQWPWTPTRYTRSIGTMNLSQGDDVAYSALPQRYFTMMPEQMQLEKNKQYQVLLHLAWRQKIAGPRHAQPIHIFGGNIYDGLGHAIGKAEYGQQPFDPSNIWQVNGTITPSLIRYINIKLNLLFSQPLSSLPKFPHNNNVQGRFAYFRLQQDRRMRSDELNFIGHPLYGVLIKIVPVE